MTEKRTPGLGAPGDTIVESVRAPDLRAAILRKVRESAAAQEQLFTRDADRIEACARAVAAKLAAGGRILTMGNGGSACDAEHVAVEFMHPVVEKRTPFPAEALGSAAFLSAVGNDEDFALAFAKQVRLLGRAGDVALGISTSGMSAGVNRGLRAAREVGMMTIGFAGRDGGRLAEVSDHLFVVPSFSIHRIQEAHVTLLHVLWDLVHVVLGAEDVL